MVASGEQVADRSIIVAFDVIAIVITTLLLLVIFTATFSRQVKRRPSWFNLMLPSMLYPASFLFLLGAQDHTQPPFASCALQAVLIYSLPAYCTTGFSCFVLDFYLLLRRTVRGSEPSKIVSRTLLVAPPLVFFAVLVVDLVLILADREIRLSLKPDVSGVYCHSQKQIPSLLAIGVGAPAFFVWFVVYVTIALHLRRYKCAISSYNQVLRGHILSVFIRMSLMTLATCIGLALIIRAAIVPIVPSHVSQPYSVLQYLVFPGLVFSIFGTQLEFFKCWTCRRPAKLPQQGTDGTSIASINS